MKTLLSITLLVLSGCAMSPEQLQALGPGDKAVCFHARGPGWSTTTVGTAATDGKVPTITETCEVNPRAPK